MTLPTNGCEAFAPSSFSNNEYVAYIVLLAHRNEKQVICDLNSRSDNVGCCAGFWTPAITKDPRAQLAGVQKAPRHEVAGSWAPVCTENPIRVDDVMESPKLAE